MINRERQSTAATSSATTNYDLPLWDGTDMTSWQGNLNDAFNKIDTAIFAVQEQYNNFQTVVDEVKDIADKLTQQGETTTADLKNLEDKFTTLNDSLTNTINELTEAQKAIVDLQNEDTMVKAQMDNMQDDIGKLMDWHTGMGLTLETPVQVDDGEADFTFRSILYTGASLIVYGDYHTGTQATSKFQLPDTMMQWLQNEGYVQVNSNLVVVSPSNAYVSDEGVLGNARLYAENNEIWLECTASNAIDITLNVIGLVYQEL